jgi:hypothetical protein
MSEIKKSIYDPNEPHKLIKKLLDEHHKLKPLQTIAIRSSNLTFNTPIEGPFMKQSLPVSRQNLLAVKESYGN